MNHSDTLFVLSSSCTHLWISNFFHSLCFYSILQNFFTCSIRSSCLPVKSKVAATTVAPTSAAEKMELTMGLLGMFGSIISTQLKQLPLYTCYRSYDNTMYKSSFRFSLENRLLEEDEHKDGSRPNFLLHLCFYS